MGYYFREATTLTQEQANLTLSFVESRSKRFATNIKWTMERSALRQRSPRGIKAVS